MEKEKSKKRASGAIRRFMTINGIPGVSVGVSVDGEVVWKEGFGFACVETGASCTADTIMCIASISKSITAAIAGRLVDDGVLDLNCSIYNYLEPDDFPRKIFNGKSVDITTRHLLSHRGGIRHYNKCNKQGNDETEKDKKDEEINKKEEDNKQEDNKQEDNKQEDNKQEDNKQENKDCKKNIELESKPTNSNTLDISKDSKLKNKSENNENIQDSDGKKDEENNKNNGQTDDAKYSDKNNFLQENPYASKYQGVNAEFLLNKRFNSVFQSLSLFKDDDLLARPGESFNYTTHGYTLAAAVLERALNKKFKNSSGNENKKNKKSEKTFCTLLKEMFSQLGMHHTSIDEYDRIVPNRSRYYIRTNQLENIPQVDNSYKWAGGGLISDVTDLLTFANVILYSYQNTEPCLPLPYLRRQTVEQLWSASDETGDSDNDFEAFYGLGWSGVRESQRPVGGVPLEKNSGYWFHTGAAAGASSILFVRPVKVQNGINTGRPLGICVAILANCYNTHKGIVALSKEIADTFHQACSNK